MIFDFKEVFTMNRTIKGLPPELRPRERSLTVGMKYLSDQEILSILLGSGYRSHSALDISGLLLRKYGNIKGLRDLSLDEWCKEKGIGVAKATTLMAAFELGDRMTRLPLGNKVIISSSKEAADYLIPEFKNMKKEHFKLLMLTTKNGLLGIDTISIGSLNASIVHPRELFKSAIKKSAAGIILAHNHPSGDVMPSEEDILMTKRIKEGGLILGIEVLDHLIIGENGYFSFKEENLL